LHFDASMAVPTSANSPRDESLITAVVDVLDAGQKVVLDRIDLAWVEGRAAVATLATALVMALLGLAFLLVGWCALNACAVLLLAGILTTPQAVGVVAAVNLAVGGVALLLARRRADAIGGNERADIRATGNPAAPGGTPDDAGLRRADRSAAGVARA
jgi:hypothetical protein